MTRRNGGLSAKLALAGAASLAVMLAGCAPADMTGSARRPAQTAPRRTAPAPSPRDTARVASPGYRVEDELPEKTATRPAQLVERLEPVRPDTIAEKDVAIESPKARYDIGYRIQVFASADKAAAEKVRERCVAETRLAAYIEYEDGKYKVRAGDFAERKDAAEARLRIAGAFPGSWIVRTTIKK